jgi:hypothetical protein
MWSIGRDVVALLVLAAAGYPNNPVERPTELFHFDELPEIHAPRKAGCLTGKLPVADR